MTAQWKRLPTGNEAPSARAYHSMTCVGSRYLLFGGFDGKSTFGDLWWLVTEGISFLFRKLFIESCPQCSFLEKFEVLSLSSMFTFH